MNYASLIKKLFEARQIIHNEHLATNSFSAHKALGKFYEEILIEITPVLNPAR